MYDTLYSQMPVLILVFVRFTGMIAFNPLFARRNFPAMARMGLIGALTLLVAPGLPAGHLARITTLELVAGMAHELVVGLACGYVFQVFYYMLIFTGDQMDMAFGLSMAKAMDPGTNIQMSVSSTFLNLSFIIYLFSTNSHLILIRLFSTSFTLIPAGQGLVAEQLPRFMLEVFGYAFQLAYQLALPFIAMELVLEFSVGILMKFIPQINVFVVNIQLKVLLGVALLFFFVPAVSSFLNRYLEITFTRMQDLLLLMAPA